MTWSKGKVKISIYAATTAHHHGDGPICSFLWRFHKFENGWSQNRAGEGPREMSKRTVSKLSERDQFFKYTSDNLYQRDSLISIKRVKNINLNTGFSGSRIPAAANSKFSRCNNRSEHSNHNPNTKQIIVCCFEQQQKSRAAGSLTP
jgi:hypothetical protein